MVQPLLHRLHMIFWANGNPTIAFVTQNTFCIKFSDTGILGKQRVSFIESIAIFRIPASYVMKQIARDILDTCIFFDRQLLR